MRRNIALLYHATGTGKTVISIIEEFHHAAAPTYQKLLTYYKPKILLGLTATPERMDGKSILEYFDNRIAAEIRLPEAIDRKLLSPFQYFGVTDTIDLGDLKWVRGGYERSELTKLYSLNLISANKRASMIIQSVLKYVTDIEDVKGLASVFRLSTQKSFEECGFSDIIDGFIQLKNSPVMFAEMFEILQYNYNKIDFIDNKVDFGFECPLDLHCAYTRDQILVALDFMKPSTVREGVKYLPDKKADLFFVTLNKADKDYSPTTMYNDYSINEWLFHWQSQSTTSAESPTGQRYINHRKTGNKILLFVREFKKDISGAAPYTFLGFADYIKHEGSRPMSMTWKLHDPIPAKYLKKTNKLVVG